MILISLQAAATHLAIAVESLSHAELSKRRSCKQYSLISCALSQQVIFETRRTPVVTQYIDSKWKWFCTCRENHLNPFLYPFLLNEVCFCCHPQHKCCIVIWFPKVRSWPRVITCVRTEQQKLLLYQGIFKGLLRVPQIVTQLSTCNVVKNGF